MAAIAHVTGYVTAKGVERKEIGGSIVYEVSLKDFLRPSKDRKVTVVHTFAFWGKQGENLLRFVAPYDQITAVGETRDIRIIEPKNRDAESLPCFSYRGMHYSFPKRDDADGDARSRATRKRRETLQPDPAVVDDEEIPF